MRASLTNTAEHLECAAQRGVRLYAARFKTNDLRVPVQVGVSGRVLMEHQELCRVIQLQMERAADRSSRTEEAKRVR